MTDCVDALDLYWRPGCPYCFSLKRALKRRKLPVRLHNIWEDPDAAAVVRRAARGNETVPTVVIGGRFLVNPTPNAVEQLIAEVAPELLAQRLSGTGRRRLGSRRSAT
ncbi:MAG: glutaredoxin family protein [Microthrixaceae bacterium]